MNQNSKQNTTATPKASATATLKPTDAATATATVTASASGSGSATAAAGSANSALGSAIGSVDNSAAADDALKQNAFKIAVLQYAMDKGPRPIPGADGEFTLSAFRGGIISAQSEIEDKLRQMKKNMEQLEIYLARVKALRSVEFSKNTREHFDFGKKSEYKVGEKVIVLLPDGQCQKSAIVTHVSGAQSYLVKSSRGELWDAEFHTRDMRNPNDEEHFRRLCDQQPTVCYFATIVRDCIR